MNSTAMRALIGFLVAPAVPALALYFVNVNGEAAPLIFFVLAPFAYAAALVLGLPVYLVLQRRGTRSLRAYLILGAAIGLVFAVLFFGIQALLSWTSAREHAVAVLKNSGRSVVLALVCAVVASAVFWLIAVRRSPQATGTLRR
jgi:hypothetical protein